MLGIVAVAVALGSYPIVRRLTTRLEDLRGGRRALGRRRPARAGGEKGNDEVAFLARRFNHAAERVETCSRSHKSLLANASHELRLPLARIRMGLELMDLEPSPRTREETPRNIAELDQLIDEILLASRLDAERDGPRHHRGGGPHGPGRRGKRRRARSWKRRARSKPWWCRAWPSCCAGRSATCWRTPAATATGRCRCGSTGAAMGGGARVRPGPGGAGAERERIFEPFYRLRGASEREGGVGLGLALVRSIVQRHHGRANCEANPGGGACFVILLPVSKRNSQ